ncbi:MAG TPA: type VI secretion system baseplate subunit TssK [Polyangia bacterium]|jgi:type VI secretion system protein ImpJ|nr:type VI secretion system baseplate subunit TssK [Polyangia bacterium]
MKPPQRVVWSEGMLVSPQHMQQQDLYHERLLDERIAALAPYRWGVVSAELDAGALGTGQLKMTKFIGVLPDGLYLGFEGGDPESPPVRPIEAHFAPTQAVCEVFLGLPKERDGVPSISVEQPSPTPGASTKAARARFRAVTRPIADLTGHAQDLTMAFAHRNAVILFGDETREDYDAVKIAEIVRDGRGALITNETYIPPTLRIDSSTFLMGGVRRLLALMVAKQRLLAGDRRQREGASIEFGVGDVTRFLQLNTINAAIPMLTYATSNGEISPNQLYLLLVQVAGQLATFSPDVDPSQLPIFSFTDLRGTFEELFARVTALLRTTVREAYMTVPLEIIDGFHVGRLDEDRLLTAVHYVLAVHSEVPEDRLAQRLPGMCKIASQADLPQVIRAAASPGVPISVNHRPPSEIPVRAGVTYFSLSLQNDYWKHVLESRTVAIYLPPPFDPQRVKLELLAVARGG